MPSPRVPLSRKPAQARSRTTVQVLVDATEIAMQRYGVGRLSTRLIARLAGVSVGSLYQYFSGIQGLLHTLVERRLRERVATAAEAIPAARDLPLAAATSAFAERLKTRDPKQDALLPVLRQLVEALNLHGLLADSLESLVPVVADDLLRRRAELRNDLDTDFAAVLLMHGLPAAAMAISESRPEYTPSKLLDEFTLLATRYLSTGDTT